MGRNNDSYRFFQEMLTGHKNNEEGLVEHGARCLMDLNPNNPFPANSQEFELFFEMFLYHARWKNHTVDAKINRRKLCAAAHELCNIVSGNPYVFDKKEEAEEIKAKKEFEAQQKALEEQKKIEEQKQIEELKRKELEHKQAEEQKRLKEEEEKKSKIELQKQEHVLGVVPEEEKEKDKKSWLRFLFPWNKEGESNDSEGTH